MASYQQNYDPQSYNFKPYELPYNGIMKQIQAKTQYWNEGAQKLKTSYQNTAGLELSLDSNRQSLKGFMDTANEQVSKAAKSDLSNPDNVQSALGIFKPLYSGDTEMSQNIMGDHAITTKAKDINSKYEQLRTAQGGKGYSDINRQYSLDAYSEFVKSDDPTSWKKHYQNMKDAIPYYDYKSELDKSISNCKSVNSSPGVNTLYTTTTKTIDKNCLGASLSPNAERQMQIEGYVKYGKNYQALRDDYLPSLISSREGLTKDRATLSAQLLNTKLDPASKTAIQQQIDAHDNILSNMDKSIGKLQNNDLSDIVNNYEAIAGSTIKGRKLQAISSVFSREDKADPAQMMIARFQQDANNRKEDRIFKAAEKKSDRQFELDKQDREFDFKLKMEGKKLGKNGQIETDMTSYETTAAPDAVNRGIDQHIAALAEKDAALAQNDKRLEGFLKTDPRFKSVLTQGTNSPEFQTLVKQMETGENLPLPVQEFMKAREKLLWQKSTLIAEQQVIENLPDVKEAKGQVEAVANKVSTGETLNLSPSFPKPNTLFLNSLKRNLQPQEIQELIRTGKSGDMELKVVNGKLGTPGSEGNSSSPILSLIVNGEAYNVKNTKLQEYYDKTHTSIEAYQKVLNSKYSESYASQFPYLDLTQRNAEKDGYIDPFRRRLGAALGGIPGMKAANATDASKSVALVGSRMDGNLVVALYPDKGKPLSVDDVTKAFASQGGPSYTVKAIEGQPNNFILGNVKEFDRRGDINDTQEIQNFAEHMMKLKQMGGDPYPRTDMPNHGSYKLAVITNSSGGPRFEITDKKGEVQYAESAADLKSQLDTLDRLNQLEKQRR